MQIKKYKFKESYNPYFKGVKFREQEEQVTFSVVFDLPEVTAEELQMEGIDPRVMKDDMKEIAKYLTGMLKKIYKNVDMANSYDIKAGWQWDIDVVMDKSNSKQVKFFDFNDDNPDLFDKIVTKIKSRLDGGLNYLKQGTIKSL